MNAKSLKSLFYTHIKNDADILTDGWRGCSPLKEEYPDLKQTLSNIGKNLINHFGDLFYHRGLLQNHRF